MSTTLRDDVDPPAVVVAPAGPDAELTGSGAVG
jgi:hypothetical protein